MNRLLCMLACVLACTDASAGKSLECERYIVKGQQKSERSFYRLAYDPATSALTYTYVSGLRIGRIPSPTSFKAVWVSSDSLRVVGQWVAADYGSNQERWSPIYVLDVDFSKPMFKLQGFGGFADFDTMEVDPWKLECRRLD